MDLQELQLAAPGLADKTHREKILLFGWWLHVHQGKATFAGADIGKCYTALHLAAPSSFGGYLKNLTDTKQLLKTPAGYKLENKNRDRLQAAHGKTAVAIRVNNALSDMAAKLPNLAERAYYKEALLCYNSGSLRAAIVMTWNVAYAHLCDHIVGKHVAEFNARWLLTYPGMHKNRVKAIAKLDDLNDELKESEVIVISRDAGIISKNIYNIMHASLGRRNAAAHPSSVIIDQLQTDAYIVDLVTNVVLQIT
jgi:hypothetical protein